MKSKIHTALATALTGITLAFGAAVVQAATITVNPLDTTVDTGTMFDVVIVGQDFTDGDGGTQGGGFFLAWDPTLLTLDSYSLTFAGDQGLALPTVVDNTAGTLDADVTSLFTVVADADFDIAVLTFTAMNPTLNPQVSPLDLSIGLFDSGFEKIWADSSGFVDAMPVFVDGSVTVNAIPVPAAVWLFGSGLIGLIGVARRRM